MRGIPRIVGVGDGYFTGIELRDEKAVLTADRLPRGTFIFTYQIRMSIPGEYQVIPPVAYEFYFPDEYGRGDGLLFTVTD